MVDLFPGLLEGVVILYGCWLRFGCGLVFCVHSWCLPLWLNCGLYGFDFDVLFWLVVIFWLIVLDCHFVICMNCLVFAVYGLEWLLGMCCFFGYALVFGWF